jgi:WD40 repeat protein
VDPSDYPLIRARFYAFDANGARLSPGSNTITVLDADSLCAVRSLDCAAGNNRKQISSVFLCDLSAAAKYGLTEYALSTALQQYPFGSSEAALAGYDSKPFILKELTAERQQFSGFSLPRLQQSADINQSFLDTSAGAFAILSRARFQKIIICMLSTFTPVDENILVQAAAAAGGVKIYAIGLGIGVPEGLRNACISTGGRSFDMMSDSAMAMGALQEALQDAQGILPCQLTWQAAEDCQIIRPVQFRVGALQAASLYRRPQFSIPGLSITPLSLAFGGINPTVQASREIVITAISRTISVQNISISNPAFSIVNPGTPFTLQSGQSRRITIAYQATDSSLQSAEIQIQSNACYGGQSYASAGFARDIVKNPTDKTPLKIVFPNGGERLQAGFDTVIRWTGIMPADTVRLSFSTNAGTSWNLITQAATGLAYRWRIPLINSEQCLLRAEQIQGQGSTDSVLILSNHTQSVFTAMFSRDGRRVLTASDDGLLRIFSSFTGELQGAFPIPGGDPLYWATFSADARQILCGGQKGILYRVDASSGAIIDQFPEHVGPITCIELSPNGAILATASMDGSVILWDYPSMAVRLRARVHNSRPISRIRFNAAGTQIISCSAADQKVNIWDISNGTILQSINENNPQCAVFSPDGTYIVTGTDQEIHLYQLPALQLLSTAVLGLPPVDIDISPDSKSIIAGALADAFIYSAPDLRLQRTLSGHTGLINSIRYNSTGTQISTAAQGAQDKTARIWNLNPAITVQRDQSDALWAIQAPLLQKRDADAGIVLIGQARDTVFNDMLCNPGPGPIRILSLKSDNPEFTLADNPVLPIFLAQGECMDIRILFRPAGLGQRNASLQLITGYDTVRALITGTGQIAALLGNTLIDMGDIQVGQSKDSFAVLFVGTQFIPAAGLTIDSLKISVGADAQYSLSGALPTTLQPLDTVRLTVRFNPLRYGRISGRVQLYTSAGMAITQLIGRGVCGVEKPLRFTLRTNKPLAEQADTILVQIGLPRGIADSGVRVNCRLRYNSTVLLPLSGSIEPLPGIQDEKLNVQQFIAEADTVIRVPMLIGWGNTDTARIRIESFSTELCPILFIPASTTMPLEICRANGARLYLNGQKASMRIWFAQDSPMLELAAAESGAYQVQITDLRGVQCWQHSFSAAKDDVIQHHIPQGLATGIYCVHMYTPSAILHTVFAITGNSTE